MNIFNPRINRLLLLGMLAAPMLGCEEPDKALKLEPGSGKCLMSVISHIDPPAIPEYQFPEMEAPDLESIQAELDLEENLRKAIDNKRLISTFYIKEGEFDKAVAPASFPLFWEPDSLGQQVEALFVIKILSDERISVTVDCEDCRPIDLEGKLADASSGIHSRWEGKPSDMMVSEHWKIQLRPRKMPISAYKDQVLKVRMRSAETFLSEAKTKLKLSQPNAAQSHFELRYEDDAIYLTQSFLRKLSVAIGLHDREKLLAPLEMTLDSMDAAIKATLDSLPDQQQFLAHLDEEKQNLKQLSPEKQNLIRLLERQSSLMKYRDRLLPRLLVLAREVPCN